ncbi:metalloendopeptidase OMA1, mitochondrial-like isoform X2 [Corticium candelabrum]|uniref:metalloendopeptidase OMA1, mitochondrial-like isoform X2 n=1 Tax=Corticium candelabrum TaxID=121492 RepID=UPI002E25EE8D|nr:metalloendopeptidase OMA1, mitochondrial-like isoform X2 [Corticium candelabrum]
MLISINITNKYIFVLSVCLRSLCHFSLFYLTYPSCFTDKIVSAGHPSYARVLGVTTKLLQANKWDEALDVNWRIVIIDDPTVTAYVMPSGQIVVYTGLLEMMKTDDMLAVILGHEMAHAIMGHMGENASQEQ